MAKYVCLSFDDGPNNQPGDNTMNDMLDILEKYSVPASFFLIGNKITEENRKVILRAFNMGCDIQHRVVPHSEFGTQRDNQDIAAGAHVPLSVGDHADIAGTYRQAVFAQQIRLHFHNCIDPHCRRL